METVEPDSDYEGSEADSDAEAPAHKTVSQLEGSHDENLDTSNVPRTAEPKNAAPKTAEPGSAVPKTADPESTVPRIAEPASKAGSVLHTTGNGAASMPKRKRRRTGAIQEGTYIGGGCRMMCYCPKHSHVTQQKAQAHLAPPLVASVVASQYAETDSQEQKQKASQQASGGQETACVHAATAVGDPVPQAQQEPQHQAGCIRGVPYNHACRRGQQEPDAIAAALAKRLFVSKTPYLLGAARHHSRSSLPVTRAHADEQPFSGQQSSTGQDLSDGQSQVKTQTERFKEMQQTVASRLTCGKSAIHGLGAFTKAPHQAGT